MANTELDSFNDLNHNALTLSRSPDHGILIYRQIYTHSDQGDTLFQKEKGANADTKEAKLIAVLGQKELKNANAGITWIDY